MPQETPRLCPASRAGTPSTLSCIPSLPTRGWAEWKLTFFFQMPFTPGTASYSLLMASLQALAGYHLPVTAAGLCPFPAASPTCGSAGSGAISPRSPGCRSIPAALPHGA